MPCCRDSYPDGLWKDVYGDPVRPRRNGYAWPLDFLQIASWAFIFIISSIHLLVEVPFLEGSLFIVILVISLVMVFSVASLKVCLEILSQEDPAVFKSGPPRLEQESLTEEAAPEGKEPCIFCRRFVQKGCKHCSVCDKCVPGFDHHCRWLNTCVGEKNYHLFAAFMGFAWIGMVWIGAFSIWFIQHALRDIERFKQRMHNRAYHSNFKAFPVVMVFVFVCLSLSVVGVGLLGKLICFHIYLRYTSQTTYDYLLERRERKKQKGTYISSSQKPHKKGLCNCTQLRKRRDFKKHSKPIGESILIHFTANERAEPVPERSDANGTPLVSESTFGKKEMNTNNFDNSHSRMDLQPAPLCDKNFVPLVQEEAPNHTSNVSREPIDEGLRK